MFTLLRTHRYTLAAQYALQIHEPSAKVIMASEELSVSISLALSGTSVERPFALSRLVFFRLSAHRLVLCFLVKHSPVPGGSEWGEEFKFPQVHECHWLPSLSTT